MGLDFWQAEEIYVPAARSPKGEMERDSWGWPLGSRPGEKHQVLCEPEEPLQWRSLSRPSTLLGLLRTPTEDQHVQKQHAAEYKMVMTKMIWVLTGSLAHLRLPQFKSYRVVRERSPQSKTYIVSYCPDNWKPGPELIYLKKKKFRELQWLRLWAPNAVGLGSMPGQGTWSHMLQIRVHMPQLRPTAAK